MAYTTSLLNTAWAAISFCRNLRCDSRIVWSGGPELDNISILNAGMTKYQLTPGVKTYASKNIQKVYLIMKDGWLTNYPSDLIFRDGLLAVNYYGLLVKNNSKYFNIKN